MKEVYYLIGPDGYVVSKFEPTGVNGASINGNVYVATAWGVDSIARGAVEYEFLAYVYCKFDSCTHWWFNGEDYDVELKTEKNSYYHLCGSNSFVTHIRTMCFIWRLAPKIMKAVEPNNDWTSEYRDYKIANELVDLMLKNHTIERVTEE